MLKSDIRSLCSLEGIDPNPPEGAMLINVFLEGEWKIRSALRSSTLLTGGPSRATNEPPAGGTSFVPSQSLASNPIEEKPLTPVSSLESYTSPS